MLQRCSNPEIRAEQGGFSALDQVSNKVTLARLPKYHYSAPENSQRQGWTKIGKIAEQAHLSWDGIGPAAELNTPFTMNSISNAYDNIEIVHGCRFVP